jgi:hypothetical protein
MKKFLAILFAIILIQIFNLINSSFEPLADEKLQLINIVLVTIYSIVVLGLSIFFRRYPKIKEIVNKLIGIISLFVLVNLPWIFKITDMGPLLVLLDLSLCIYYYRKYIKRQSHKEIINEECIADKYHKRRRIGIKFYIIIGYLVILADLFKNLILFFKNNIVYFILMIINIGINVYIIFQANQNK